MDFCKRLERYFHLASQVAKVSLSEADGEVFLCLEPLVEVSGETEDAFLGFLVLDDASALSVQLQPTEASSSTARCRAKAQSPTTSCSAHR